MDDKKKIISSLKKSGAKCSIQLPSGIEFECDDARNVIIMTMKSIDGNMQQDDFAFESWAIVLKTYLKYDIELNVENYVNMTDSLFEAGKHNTHGGRFLYRVMKFLEQYKDWFHIDEKLKSDVKKFTEKIYKSEKMFSNTLNAKGDAGQKKDHGLENSVEALFAGKKGKEKLESYIKGISLSGEVYRQMPVGLFYEKISDKSRIFSGGKSAIDLWFLNEKELNIIELKARNNMIGIITEIFFYANYMSDLLISHKFLGVKKKGKGKYARGVGSLVDYINGGQSEKAESINQINAIMLADEYHPLVTDKVLETLWTDSEHPKIKYFRKLYYLNIKVDDISI